MQSTSFYLQINKIQVVKRFTSLHNVVSRFTEINLHRSEMHSTIPTCYMLRYVTVIQQYLHDYY